MKNEISNTTESTQNRLQGASNSAGKNPLFTLINTPYRALQASLKAN